MIQSNARLGIYLRALGVSIALIFSTAYVIFSYYQTSKDLKSKSYTLFLQNKEDVNKAFQELHKFFSFTESRLLNSFQHKERIIPILSVRTEHLIEGPFPDLVSLTFVSPSNPKAVYSRFGKALLEPPIRSEKNGFRHLGNGKFRLRKVLLDKKKKSFGVLQSTFSITHLLYKHFPEIEIDIYPEKGFTNNQPSFTIFNLPYVFVLNHKPLSFWRFLLAFKLQILSTLVFGIVLLFTGMATGLSFNQKLLMKWSALNQRLKGKLKALEEEQTTLGAQLLASQNFLKLKENSRKETKLLMTTLEERYRQMAGQAQAINLLTSKLILEEAKNDKLLKEIHAISQESNTILRKLVNGYPIRGMEEGAHVSDCLDRIKAIFLPEIIEKNVRVEILGNIKTYLSIDRLAFELVLYNVFQLVMDRCIKNNRFKIELKEEDFPQITFYDDGYDIEEKLHKINNKPPQDSILCLDKKRLRDFIGYLGWEVSFQNEGTLSNSIKLSIPPAINESAFPSNVVNMFDFKPYAQ